MNDMAKALRAALATEVARIPPGPVAIGLSSGVDSCSLLALLMEAKRAVTVYSFSREDHDSTDFLAAQETAKRLDLAFCPVRLPVDPDHLLRDIRTLTRDYGAWTKTAVECGWPMSYLFDAVATRARELRRPVGALVIGLAAGGHFGNSKKAMMHHRHTVEEFDRYRDSLWVNPDYSQGRFTYRYASERGIHLSVPYRTPALVAWSRGRSWDELNRPKQKQPIRDAFPEMTQYAIGKEHINFQMGDSRIQELFLSLLDLPRTRGRFQSPVSLYRAIARGEVYVE